MRLERFPDLNKLSRISNYKQEIESANRKLLHSLERNMVRQPERLRHLLHWEVQLQQWRQRQAATSEALTPNFAGAGNGYI